MCCKRDLHFLRLLFVWDIGYNEKKKGVWVWNI